MFLLGGGVTIKIKDRQTQGISPGRDIRFDILRVIGLLCIVLAHTDPPTVIFQLRNFDVPLMAVISGAVFAMSEARTGTTYGGYLVKRAYRLIAPTWVFLVIFFAISYLAFAAIGKPYPFTQGTILSSFTLTSGIGYVWIIRVYLIAAVVAPLFLKLSRKLTGPIAYYAVIAVIYALYEVFYLIHKDTGIYIVDFFVKYYVLYLLPFGCLVGIGIRIPKMSRKAVYFMLGIFAAVFIGFVAVKFSGHFIQTQLYKYPPRLYYVSYALMATFGLYLLAGLRWARGMFDSRLVRFLSSSSMWIYLWHIMYIYYWNLLQKHMPAELKHFAVKFLIWLVLASLTTYIQKLVVRYVVDKFNPGPGIRNTASVLFLR